MTCWPEAVSINQYVGHTCNIRVENTLEILDSCPKKQNALYVPLVWGSTGSRRSQESRDMIPSLQRRGKTKWKRLCYSKRWTEFLRQSLNRSGYPVMISSQRLKSESAGLHAAETVTELAGKFKPPPPVTLSNEQPAMRFVGKHGHILAAGSSVQGQSGNEGRGSVLHTAVEMQQNPTNQAANQAACHQ
jgi:hypothetical protein